MSIFRLDEKPQLELIVAFFLIGLAVAIPYAQVASFEFVSFDDSLYVYENPNVLKGITFDSVQWAFGFSDRAYWHPLTWLSLMADMTLFGLSPVAFHLHNVFLHMLNGWLLCFLLWRVSGSIGKSLVVALLFTLHPINVETVAWVAERKNLLAGLFWMLSLLSYCGYCQRPTVGRYGRTVLLFVLGLMAKPVLVALPLVFLVWDEWPLARSAPPTIGLWIKALKLNKIFIFPGSNRWGGLVIEKLPFFALAVFTAILATLSAAHHGIVVSTSESSMALRLANAVVSTLNYILKMIFPYQFSVYYPYPDSIPAVNVAGAVIILTLVTVLLWKRRKKAGYCLAGWMWFLVTLAPTSGIKQAGLWPAMADRWAYLPLIGLFIAITWGIGNFLERRREAKWIPATILLIMCGMIFLTWRQTRVWSDSQTLYSHAVEVDPRNHIAHSNLGGELYRSGKPEKAIEHFVQALLSNPDYADAQNNLLTALERQIGRENILPLLKRLSLTYPENPAFPYLMGYVALHSGNPKLAIRNYLNALEKKPNFIQALNELGRLYVLSGECESALQILQRRATLASPSSGLFYDMARCYAYTGEKKKALITLDKALDHGFDEWQMLAQDPWMAEVREEPTIRKLIDSHR